MKVVTIGELTNEPLGLHPIVNPLEARHFDEVDVGQVFSIEIKARQLLGQIRLLDRPADLDRAFFVVDFDGGVALGGRRWRTGAGVFFWHGHVHHLGEDAGVVIGFVEAGGPKISAP